MVKIEFDPVAIDYEHLVRQFFRMHDPTQLNRQGPDVGDSYRSVIFYVTDEQKQIAEAVRDEAQAQHDAPIVTQIVSEQPFYEAEDYHQKYAERTGRGMCHIPYAPV